MKKFLFIVCFYTANSFGGISLLPWQEKIITNTEKIYSPVATKEFDRKFTILIEENPLAAANAIFDEEIKVVINTGLLRSNRLTPDSLRMILCHELGHVFGGAPRKNIPPEWEGPIASDGLSYMSSEGQADAYAALACFKVILSKSQTADEPKTDLTRIGPLLLSKCTKRFANNENKRDLCLRTAFAGFDFLNLVFDFPISPETPDSTVATELIRNSYPARQCRLDTIVNGALCGEKLHLGFSFYDQNANDCQRLDAKRPTCWFPETH